MDGGAKSIHDKNNMSRDDKYRCNAFTSDTKLSEVVFQLHLCVSVSESDYWIVSSRITHARAQNNYLRPACHYDRPQHKMTDPGLALPAILQRSK